MKKPDIAKRLARQQGVSKAEAADELDRVIHDILAKLRKGQTAPLPGLGHFTPGPKGVFQFEKERQDTRARRRRAHR
jgi:nucleoid DNA-binding protein